MWSTLETFKNNITQIASDVLDTQEELETQPHGGSVANYEVSNCPRQSISSNKHQMDFMAELDYNRSNYNQLQSTASVLEANWSLKYAALAKEKEAAVSVLNEEIRVLKERMLLQSKTQVVMSNGGDDQVISWEESVEEQIVVPQGLYQVQVKVSEAQLDSTNLNSRETLAAQGKKGDLAVGNAVFLYSQKGQQEELGLGFTENEKQEDFEKQVMEKENALVRLTEAHKQALAESERLKEELKTGKSMVLNLESDLRKTRLDAEAAIHELHSIRTLKEQQAFQAREIHDKADQAAISDAVGQELQRTVTRLEDEESDLQVEKEGRQQYLETQKLGVDSTGANEEARFHPSLIAEYLLKSKAGAEQVTGLSQTDRAAEEACRLFKVDFERKLEEMSSERDKALSNLERLRKNLLDMELSTSDKMEQDSMRIADLETRLQFSEGRVSILQQALNTALKDLADAIECSAQAFNQASNEKELMKQKFESCAAALESKDMEISNLQSALGQYYAESDAQEDLQRELDVIRHSNVTLAESLRIANGTIELKIQELNVAMENVANSELRKQDMEQSKQKLEGDVLHLRCALEQSITSLNRMSSDSDFYVDRRIVIKLLVTYLQRHHSREVLDLMVRMLGFSEEDKERVQLAQRSARGGIVKGVFSLRNPFVGAIFNDSASVESPLPPPEHESFTDLWIDFLLKESEERGRRERKENADADGKYTKSDLPSPPISRLSNPTSSAGAHHKSSNSFSGISSSVPLLPRPFRVLSASDLESL